MITTLKNLLAKYPDPPTGARIRLAVLAWLVVMAGMSTILADAMAPRVVETVAVPSADRPDPAFTHGDGAKPQGAMLPAPVPATVDASADDADGVTAEEAPEVGDDEGEPPSGTVVLEVFRLGRVKLGVSALLADVGYRIEAVGGRVPTIEGRTESDSIRHDLTPGEYVLSFDRADLGPGHCEGGYSQSIEVAEDEDTYVLAFSVEDGADAFGTGDCMSVVMMPSLDSLPPLCAPVTPEAETVVAAADEVAPCDELEEPAP